MKYIIPILVYAVMTVFNAGALNADLRGQFKGFHSSCWKEDGRRHLAFATGISLLPPTWLVSPFVTGFYEYGWTLEHGAWGACL